MSAASTFVVMMSGGPLAAASTLDAAKDDAEKSEAAYAVKGETRWDEYRPGEWRLMRRAVGRRRFAWSQYWVAEVPDVSGVSR
ncbi:hypothetical protein [Streptomyces phytophilus]|uniref:hypothetical protein n=1 Tax=Streptomyces phytophilus TaxID=722715 RepID=UPI0015F1032C|nr:hypothetical protein [Streptomyces phytophilus]